MPSENGAPIGDYNLSLERKKINYDVFDFCGGRSLYYYGD